VSSAYSLALKNNPDWEWTEWPNLPVEKRGFACALVDGMNGKEVIGRKGDLTLIGRVNVDHRGRGEEDRRLGHQDGARPQCRAEGMAAAGRYGN